MGSSEQERLCFPGLATTDFQHPADIQALDALKKVKGMDFLTKKAMELGLERLYRVENVASNLEITDRQCPSLYKIYRECSNVLDIDSPPELFLKADPYPNAYTYGMTRPFLVMHSGILGVLTEKELRYVLGHELGHYKCGHTFYTTMGIFITQLLETLGQMTLGISGVVGTGVQLAFLIWERKSELSADRAGLLVSQDEDAATGTLMKITVPVERLWKEIRIEEILKQAKKFEEISEDTISKVIKFYLGVQMKHPWTIVRAKEISDWAKTAQYRELLQNGISIEQYAQSKATRPAALAGRKKLNARVAQPPPPPPPPPPFQQVEMKYCISCGASIPERAKHCAKCGAAQQ